jgi:hypothetical protein
LRGGGGGAGPREQESTNEEKHHKSSFHRYTITLHYRTLSVNRNNYFLERAIGMIYGFLNMNRRLHDACSVGEAGCGMEKRKRRQRSVRV